jgi:cytochrome P450
VLISALAANRDSGSFPDPGRLDVIRPATGQVAFGALVSGLHRLPVRLS